MSKTNHKTGYHKPIKNPTTNAAKDKHPKFCERCKAYNHGCPNTMSDIVDENCDM